MKTIWKLTCVILMTCLATRYILLGSHILFNSAKTIKISTCKTHNELIQKARSQSNCSKHFNTNYIVCDSLPFTQIQCNCSSGTSLSNPYIVPNIVHLIWFGERFGLDHFYQYLSLRSVASIQQPDGIYIYHNIKRNLSDSGKIWKRIMDEIPCLHVVYYDEPLTVFGNKISTHLLRSDVARLDILLQHGGVYIDFDVITLKSYDPLRVYSTTIGRSVSNKISNGIILAESKSPFIKAWYDEYKNYKEGSKSYAYWGVNIPMQLYQKRPDLRAHMEETSLNRPNPWVDGWDATSTGHVDLEDNYFLHIHPSGFIDKGKDVGDMMDWSEDRIRRLDAVYGTAARIALFGSPDLVFFKGEETFQIGPKRKFRSFDSLREEDLNNLKPGLPSK